MQHELCSVNIHRSGTSVILKVIHRFYLQLWFELKLIHPLNNVKEFIT